MYLSLMAALVAALLALGLKRQLNAYSSPKPGSIIERCGVRQHKHDGLQRVTSGILGLVAPLIIFISLTGLALGLCIRMWFTNFVMALYVTVFTVVAFVLLVQYMLSFRYWMAPPWTVGSASPAWWHHFLDKTGRKLFGLAPLSPPPTLPTSTALPDSTVAPWLTPTALIRVQRANINDVQCVSWILKDITDPVALDAAIRLAGTIRWFDYGSISFSLRWLTEKQEITPPYDLIVSALEACFDSTGKVYPGFRDRVYYSARAILWIHVWAACISEESALEYPLPTVPHDPTFLDRDLKHLLGVYSDHSPRRILARMYDVVPGLSPMHLQWTWSAALRLSWGMRRVPGTFHSIEKHYVGGGIGATFH